MNESKGLLGLLSMLGTFGLLVLIAWKSDVFGMVFREMAMLLTGDFREVASNHTTFLMMFPVIFAVVVLELPCTIGSAVLQAKILGESGKHAVSESFKEMKEGNHFFTFFFLVLIEELFARWLFLGYLTKFAFLSGTVAFYALFFIGNGIWALIHLKNYKTEKDRHVLRVLPQFVAGTFFTYVFVKYGLLATILAHFASNAVLFAMHKVQRINVVDVLIISYGALCAYTSYVLMEKPLTSIQPWFYDNPVFRLQGWEFWDYIKVSVFFSSCLVVIFGLLFYDRGEAGKNKSDVKFGFIEYLIGLPIIIGLLYGVYYLLGMFIADVPYRVLVVAILLTFLQKGTSGSAVARTFWSGLPGTYVTICILQALGFWSALGWIAVQTVILTPKHILTKIDD